MSKILFY